MVFVAGADDAGSGASVPGVGAHVEVGSGCD